MERVGFVRRWYRRLLKCVLVCLGLLGALIAVVVILAVVFAFGEPGDGAVQRAEAERLIAEAYPLADDERNTWDDLVAAVAAIETLRAGVNGEARQILGELTWGRVEASFHDVDDVLRSGSMEPPEDLDGAALQRWVLAREIVVRAEAEGLLDEVFSAVVSGVCEPRIEVGELLLPMSLEQSRYEVVRTASRALRARLSLEMESGGDADDVLEWVEATLRLGDIGMRSPLSIEFLVGSSVKGAAYDHWVGWATVHRIDAERVARARALFASEVGAGAVDRVLEFEALAFAELVDRIHDKSSGRRLLSAESAVASRVDFGGVRAELPKVLDFAWLVFPNRDALLRVYDDYMEVVERMRSSASDAEGIVVLDEAFYERRTSVAWWLHWRWTTVDVLATSVSAFARWEFTHELKRRKALMRVAALEFELAEGRGPGSVRELVDAGYLDAALIGDTVEGGEISLEDLESGEG